MSSAKVEFKINDQVIHCREGLSVIYDSSTMGDRDYFLVKASRGSGETIYVPFATATSIIRHLMNKKEADELLKFMKDVKKEFNLNTKQRRDGYKRSLASGDVKEIATLSRHLFFFNEMGPENGEVKLGPVDLDMLQFADNMLMDEFSITYGINREEINEFINNRINSL